jgi:hypothetical protein
VEFALATLSAFDPDRRLYDVLIVRGGDGVIFLEARHRSERARGDILGTVYASEAGAAIETLARRFEPGGTVQHMALWGLRRLGTQPPSIFAEVSQSGRQTTDGDRFVPEPDTGTPSFGGQRPY